MCLLVKQPATTSFTDDFLSDVYSRNSDGFGVMYAEGDKVHVFKCLPTNAQEFIDFYRAHADGKDCIWHARMQTHGDIDMDNCHPYKVTDDIWMAHNGVLSTGNDSDQTRSDTWHFIRNILSPALKTDPDLMLDPNWIKFVGSIVGSSNKFGFVRSDGQTAIVNEKSGVNFVGAWLSNTYAWSTTKFGFQAPYQSQSKYGGYQGSGWTGSWNHGYNDTWSRSLTTTTVQEKEEEATVASIGRSYSVHGQWVDEDEPYIPSAREVKPYIRAAHNQWVRHGVAGIKQWILDAPHKAAAVLNFWYDDTAGFENLVEDDPEEAAVWVEDLFRTDSISPSMLG